MKQGDAVKKAIMAVLAQNGIAYVLGGDVPVSAHYDVFKKDVKAILFKGFRSGEIEMKEESKVKYRDDKELEKYINGLLNNWVRKTPEFNGGNSYVPKNPGSRTGSQDEQIKALKGLLASQKDPATRAQIQEAIDARMAEIKPTKTTEINVDALPEHLRYLVSQAETEEVEG